MDIKIKIVIEPESLTEVGDLKNNFERFKEHIKTSISKVYGKHLASSDSVELEVNVKKLKKEEKINPTESNSKSQMGLMEAVLLNITTLPASTVTQNEPIIMVDFPNEVAPGNGPITVTFPNSTVHPRQPIFEPNF